MLISDTNKYRSRRSRYEGSKYRYDNNKRYNRSKSKDRS